MSRYLVLSRHEARAGAIVGRQRRWWNALAIVGLAALPAGAAEGRKGFELGVSAGIVQPAEELAGATYSGIEPTFGLRMGSGLTRRLGWFADALSSSVDTETFAGTADSLTGRAGLELWLRPQRRTQWFVSGAAGFMELTFDNATDFRSAFAAAGVGQRIPLGERLFARWELVAEHTLARDGLRGEDLTEARLLGSLVWQVGLGSRDHDRDDVPDRRDRCPGTPAGAAVDRSGCPTDADGDGVPDGLDRCPGSELGQRVGPDGCEPDTDGDGVADSFDRCPGTPSGAPVDGSGCAPDEDGDGVPDGRDLCPATPRGVHVSTSGCPKDEDGDGVFDGLDRCPGTPRGFPVDRSGCPRDDDGDGVQEGFDRCPGTPPGTRVDRDGCPVGG